MSLGLMIKDIVAKVPTMLSGLTIDISVNTVNTGIDPSTNKPVVSSVQQDRFKATITELTEDEKQSSALRITELKLIVFCDGKVIDAKSTVTVTRLTESGLTNEKYNIIKCEPTYAGAVAVINTLYLRK